MYNCIYFAPASVRSCTISENLKCLAASSAAAPSFSACFTSTPQQAEVLHYIMMR